MSSLENLQFAIEYANRKTREFIDSGGSPGAGLSIANDQGSLFIQGYGISNLKKDKPYTENTTILLASVSKSLSGTLLAILQKDEDVLNIPVRIKMINKYLTKNLTVKDLVSHRSGIPTQFGTYQESVGYSRENIIERLQFTPNTEFRDTEHYTNLPFSQGVEVGVNAVGLTLEEGYQLLFETIGMENSSIDYLPYKYIGYADLRLLGQKCMGSDYNDNVIYPWFPIPKYNVEEQMPAGGIYTNLIDMNKFITYQLSHTLTPEFEDGVYVNHETNSIIGTGINTLYRTINGVLYKIHSISGGLENTRTRIVWIKQLNVGIFVHTNSSPVGFPEALTQAFLILVAGGTLEEAEAEYEIVFKQATEESIAEFCPIVFKTSETGCSVKRIKYSGKFFNQIYGQVTIYNDATIRIGKLRNVSKLWQKNNKYTFIAYDKFKIPHLGILKILNSETIKITYSCTTAIYNKIC